MEATNQNFSLGKSIIVPSVLELAKDPIESIPDRYIQLNQDTPVLALKDEDDLQVPIICMENLLNGDILELEKLHSACQEWGFFQLINHGVDKQLIEKFKVETKEFFNLPIEDKQFYWQTSSEVEGFGQANVVSEDQKLDWADILFVSTLPKHLRKPNLLPMLPLPYRDTMESYSVEMQNLAMKLFESMSKALKIDIATIKNAIGDEGTQAFRINYYPPCPEPDKVNGIAPHSDNVVLTIVLQFDEVQGLQIMKDGKWVPIKPLQDAFVVNVGDVLEILSNGNYRSILHRAIVNAEKERMSVAVFHGLGFDREVGPIPDLITPNTPARFGKISMTDYATKSFSRALDGKAYLELFKINENTLN